MPIGKETIERLTRFQRDEETSARLYERIARRERDPENRRVLLRMAADEREHAARWRGYTGVAVGASRPRLAWLSLLSWLLGYTFVLKWLENDESLTAREYERIAPEIPEVLEVMEQEERHERQLQAMLDEERLRYVGAMVLGLNDALVELTGTIAGLTFALADTRLVALAGIITGVSATLSMTASNYLAERAEGNADALRSCFYTGAAYLVTVVLLVLPYLLLPRSMYMAALGLMLAVVVGIIFMFNYYISVAKSVPFARRFWEMAGISLGVAVISFAIGLLAKALLGVEV